ncbi:ATP-binding protein [Streptomyces sp. AK02-01A]|uniref:ATP-binding protein n=1 Tax=Streptomyces sp. AK02-01A TaxID=3028648 RepID=UPI0029A1F36C|nr:ATP-binding protein [Streptomyces sp. AK02-01A]MDX3849317.1 ATP-binding protein [Streptomyces sp. AK02-01A]
MSFTVGEHSARHLRRIVRTYLCVWKLEELCDAAELALTELLANVVRHVPGRGCSVLILRQPGSLRVEVTDREPRLPQLTMGQDPDELAEDGRGLLLVDAVTDRWGVRPRPDGGKTVWFECEAKEPSRSRSLSDDL